MKALVAAVAFFVPAYSKTQPQTVEERLSAKEERLEMLAAHAADK